MMVGRVFVSLLSLLLRPAILFERKMTMKKQEMCEVNYCDACGKRRDYLQKCCGCVRELCCDCMEGRMVTYPPGVQSSGDNGNFCNKCDANPPEKVKAIHAAFREIMELRVIEKSWCEDFDKRCKAAEARLKKLRAVG